MQKKAYFSVSDIRRYAGFKTNSMVDYLCRAKLILPSKKFPYRKGRKRLFDLEAVVMARLYRQLLEQGVTVAKLKAAIENSNDLKVTKVDEKGFSTGVGFAKYLVTDGSTVYLRRKADEVLDLVNRQMVFSFMVDIKSLHQETIKKISSDRPNLFA